MELVTGFGVSLALKYLTSPKFITYPLRRHPPFYHLSYAIMFSLLSISLNFFSNWWPNSFGGSANMSEAFKVTHVTHEWLVLFRAAEVLMESLNMLYSGIAKSKWETDMIVHHAIFLTFVYLNPYPGVSIFYMAAAELSIIPLLISRIFSAYSMIVYQNYALIVAIPIFIYFRIASMVEANNLFFRKEMYTLLFLSLSIWFLQLFWIIKVILVVFKNYEIMNTKRVNRKTSVVALLKTSMTPKDFRSVVLGKVSIIMMTPIKGDSNLFESGLDSIRFIQLRSFIKNEFGVLLDPELLATYDTIDGLSEWYNNRRNSKSSIALILDSGEPSLGQERLFVLTCKNETDAYNVPFLVKFSKPLLSEHLVNSIKDAVRHHKILHAAFKPDGSYMLNSKKIEIPILKMTEEDANQYCCSNAKHRFDIFQGPLYLFAVIQVNNKTWLFGNLHHLISDGWSIGVLLQDIGTRYNNKPLTVVCQYEDYVRYDRSVERTQGQAFWDKYLKEMKPFTLSTALSESVGAGQRHVSNLTNVNKLNAYCGKHHTTAFNCFVSLLLGLFGLYGNEEDVVIGTVFANRMRTEDTRTVGYFVRTLPFRQEYNPDISFAQLLEQVKKTSVSLMIYQDYLPEPEQMANLKILFVLQNNEMDVTEFKCNATFHTLATNNVQFDLVIQIIRENDIYKVIWDYNVKMYKSTFIQQISRHFESYYNAILVNSSFKLVDAPILSESEKIQQTVQFNSSTSRIKATITAHEQFVRISKLYPNKVALVFQGLRLTFSELNRKSNALAQILINKECGTGGLIGLHTERSVDVIIGILGIWKSGNGYLPLDPSLPFERLLAITNTANIKLIVCNKIPTWSNHILIEINRSLEADNVFINETIQCSSVNTLSNCAYCLFTSGSTGTPKGVMISHFNLMSFYYAFHQNIKFDDSDVWAMNHTFTFDLSIGEVALGLLTGCKVVMVDKDVLLNDVNYLQLITSEEMSMIWIPINMFLNMTRSNTYKPNRYIRFLFAGEKIDISKIPQWVYDSGMQIIVGYGPTESTIICSCSYPQGPTDIPNNLGNPFPDTQMYVLNKNLKPCPIGVVGQVYIGGSLVGMGYLSQIELTKSKFIKNPFHGGLMYQSGDLARLLSNGQFQFTERCDFQVKLRGFRIELGEIESCLDSHLLVQQSVVIVSKQIKEEDSYIAAYVILKQRVYDNIIKEELYQICKSKLPLYMIPSTYTVLDAFPVTPTGKFSRNGLPLPCIDDRISLRHGKLPTSRMEILVAGMMESTLNQCGLVISDDFYLRGGNSLKAMKLLNLLNSELHLNIPLAVLFEHTSIADLAEYLDKCTPRAGNLELENSCVADSTAAFDSNIVAHSSASTSIPLSACQSRLYLHWSINESSTYNVPLLFSTSITPDVIKKKFLDFGSYFEILRTTFHSNDNGAYQLVNSEFKLQMQQLHSDAELQIQVESLFDLSVLPLLKLFYIKLDSHRYRYLILAHHIIIDEWSWDVMLKYLTSTSAERLAATQYRDYVSYERNSLRNIDQSLLFWKNYLTDASSSKLPECGHTNDKATSHNNNNGSLLSASLKIPQLSVICKLLKISHFVYFMGTFGLFIMSVLDEHDILLATPVSTRRNAMFEKSLGFFVNTVPFRVHVVDDITLQVYYQRIKQDTLNIVENAHVPFEQISSSNSSVGDLSICFVAQESLDMENIQTEVIHNKTAKFNISMVVEYSKLGDVALHIEYNNRKYSVEYINEFMGAFIHFLENTSQLQYNRTVSSIGIKGSGIQCEPYATLTPNKVTSDVLIDEMCIVHGDKAAIQIDTDLGLLSLSFNELMNITDHYGKVIQSRSINKSFIGIYMDRSIEMIVSIISIWKANCAYVPLDPKLPDERIKFVIKEAEISLICGKHQFGVGELDIDLEIDRTTETSRNRMVSTINQKDSGNTAYCLFTSGSTGTPKGVLISHDNLVSYVKSLSLMQGIKSTDVGSMMHTFTFDVSLQESMTALFNGCTLHLFNESNVYSPESIFATVDRYKISHCSIPVSVFYKMVKEKYEIKHLLRIQLGGENLNKSKIPDWFKENSKNLQIWFMYGPTEATIACTTMHLINLDDNRDLIGRPLPGYSVYITRNKQLLPMGVYGELVVGGCGVGSGYLDAKKNENVFYQISVNTKIVDVYNTGDIARLTYDGYIEFMGRKDFQVKVRGFRVELSEIQFVIQKVKGVENIVCTVLKNKVEPYIAAYLITNSSFVSLDKVISSCQEQLPYYMMPSAFVMVQDYPIQSNGKINIKGLPLPKNLDFITSRVIVQPRNKTEEFVIGQMRIVLNKESIGVTENFFTIGGTSTLAAKFSHLIKVKIGIIFRCQTAREIANYIESSELKVVELDLKNETKIQDSVELEALSTRILTSNSKVLLTGASGFVGLFLMNELSMKCKLICPLRDMHNSIKKIKKQQIKYKYLTPNYDNIEFIELSDIKSHSVDVVIHNAAQVNFVDTYESMKPFNVEFTRDLLHHYYGSSNKPQFVYISTLSCLSINSISECANAYVQTKYVAEKICLEYHKLNYPVFCCRIGQITGDSQYGQYHSNDLVSSILKSVLISKMIPDVEYDLEWTPVDVISKEIVQILANNTANDNIVSMVPSRVYNVKELKNIVAGTKLVPWVEWKEANRENLGVYYSVLGDDFKMKRQKQDKKYEWTHFKMDLDLIKKYMDHIQK